MKSITTPVPALDKVVRICDYLSQTQGATFTQIYQNVGIAKSSASSLLNGMLAHGLLRQDKDKFYLGLRLYELGNKAAEQYDIKKIALPILEEIRDSTGLTCHLGVLEGAAPIYLLKVESPQAIIIRSWEGKRLSLHSSGLGKVLIAWLAPEELDALLPSSQPLARYTPATITDIGQLKNELAQIRARGWGYDNEEDSPGVRCIAVPVCNSRGNVVAALSVSGVTFQMPDDKRESLAQLMIDAGHKLSARLR
ncbi:IclR family transcriptional regulator [Martelella alba]|uniref:IclR family transcriptional regulator n=1 Tax=Martelella alba TaxID=2590451 RepID=A0ABY2SKD1_9HYPH|nr:IclR family transcriptional regulator [Martelella alba]TKI05511.1 IclR family transcriptional regulator [Martelella alba]